MNLVVGWGALSVSFCLCSLNFEKAEKTQYGHLSIKTNWHSTCKPNCCWFHYFPPEWLHFAPMKTWCTIKTTDSKIISILCLSWKKTRQWIVFLRIEMHLSQWRLWIWQFEQVISINDGFGEFSMIPFTFSFEKHSIRSIQIHWNKVRIYLS